METLAVTCAVNSWETEASSSRSTTTGRDVTPERAVVIEDSVPGIRAEASGGVSNA